MMEQTTERKKSGMIYAISANVLWGVLPLYWKLLNRVSAFEILAHRIVWSLIFVALLLAFKNEWAGLKKIIKNKKSMIYIFLCAVLICLNWGIFIWSVNSGHLVDASMGYYINPLVSVVLGMLVLKERMNAWEYVAFALACIGVAYMGMHLGSIPWIALALALTFGFYGLFKKMAAVDSMGGLFLETAILAPIFLMYLTVKQYNGAAAFMTSWNISLLLPISGVATGLPLIWFAKAANRVELSTIGLLFYLAPSINLIIGIFLFGESFSNVHVVSFGFIWIGLLIYTLSKLGILKDYRYQKKGAEEITDNF